MDLNAEINPIKLENYIVKIAEDLKEKCSFMDSVKNIFTIVKI